jgi:hypothetical protein
MSLITNPYERSESASAPQYTMLDLLSMSLGAEATDMRDQFFGILSHPALVPDYSRSYEEISKRYAKYFIENGDGI